MDIVTTLLIMAVCLLLEGFFSGSEIGVVSADQMRLRHEAAKGSRGARLALKMLESPEWLLSTTLVGTNIAVVTNTTMATALMIHLFGEYGSWLAVVMVAPLIWVFGEIVPKSVFQQRANAITPKAIFLLRAFSIIFFPILMVFSLLTRLLAKLVGNTEKNPFTLRDEIAIMIQMPSEEGDIQPAEQSMIRRLFNFSETEAKDIMLPLIDVAVINQSANCGEAMAMATRTSHVRLPVFEERVDRVVGVLDTLDLLGLPSDTPIADHIRQVPFVPEAKSIKDLLLELRQSGAVVAVVVDEFGGAEGIVTFEDIMEEVVEDLEDEYDGQEYPQQWLRKQGERDYLASARVELTTLKEELDLQFAEGNFVTLAGFLIHRVSAIPKPGTEIVYNGITFTVHKSTAQAVQEVQIRW